MSIIAIAIGTLTVCVLSLISKSIDKP